MSGDKNLFEVLSSLKATLNSRIKFADAAREKLKRDKVVKVSVRVSFLKIGDIDTVKEHFEGDLFVQARWREPRLDGGAKNDQYELADADSYWDPKLFIENGEGELKESVWHLVSFNDAGEATILERRRVKGTFFERMELKEYPFDCQDLTVAVSTSLGEDEIQLEEDTIEISTVDVHRFVDAQEWHLHSHITSWTRITTNIYQNSKHKHPAVFISCKASRRSRFFVWNIMLILLFIVSLVFTTFTVNEKKVENRLQLSFILLLSNITFKFSVSQTIPKVSYLTLLDKYILCCMAIQCIVCLWHAIISVIVHYHSEETAARADWIGLIVLGTIYVIFNVSFFLYISLSVKRKALVYSQKNEEHSVKMAAMKGLTTNDMHSAKISPAK